ncbi:MULTISPECIES: IS5 family transposase [Methylobacter]
MTRTVLKDDQWERIKDLLPGKASDCGVTAADNWKFIEAVLWIVGNPVRLLLTAGQTSEYTQAEALIEGFAAGYILADKGYDSDRFVSAIESSHAVPVIPSKKSRKVSRECDKELYKERNLVERFFQKLKHFRRIATRYERLVRNYQAMLDLVSTVIWLN